MPRRSSERAPRFASYTVVSIAALLTSLSAWAAITELEQVTRGSGRVIPSSRMQVIQSSEPGVVREIPVKLGDRVKSGDLLLRLDDTPNASKAGEVEAQSRALRAQIARLEVEETGNTKKPYVCPPELAKTAPGVCDSEARLLAIRRENLENKLDVLRQRVEQREREIAETNATRARLTEGFKLAEREYAMIGPMAARNLVSQMELLRTERQVAELKGQLATTKESLGRLDSALREAKLQLEEQTLQYRREVTGELTTRRAEYSVVLETLRGATERVRRTDIRSPVDGIVNAINVTTLGGFLNAGERVMDIVPVEEKLLVEARVRPADIAFITPGQRALVKVTAYDYYQYGGLNGIVEQISADSIFDQKEKEAYYSVIVRTEEAQLTFKDKSFNIIPGMTCDVDIITGQKSVLNYLLKPIQRAQQEALRER